MQVDGVQFEQFEGNDFECCLIGGIKRDARGAASLAGFQPARGAQAPTLAGLQPGDVDTAQQRPTQHIELATATGKIASFHAASGNLVDPGLLDRFEDFFTATVGIDVGMGIRKLDGNIVDVSPFHLRCPSFAMLMLYFGISTTSGVLPTMAWQARRELGSRPQALSSMSSSSSSASGRELNPSRTM